MLAHVQPSNVLPSDPASAPLAWPACNSVLTKGFISMYVCKKE